MQYPKSYVVYDFETSGLDTSKCEVVEIGAVKVKPDSIERFETIVKMKGEMAPDALRTHGISKEMSEAGAEPADAFTRFLSFAEGLPLVGHNIVRYDNMILARVLVETGLVSPDSDALHQILYHCVDTMALYRAKVLGAEPFWHENHIAFALRMGEQRIKSSLALAASELGVDAHGMTLHRAAADVELCRQVYEKLTN